MQSVQIFFFRVHPFTYPKFTGAAKCEIPKCETCQYAKAHINPTKCSTPISKPDTGGAIKASYTRPGYRVYVNHIESCLKGRTLPSFGRS